jgi:hypothetical protein
MNPEKIDVYINPIERQAYLEKLTIFLQTVVPSGAVSDETEAQRLYRRLLQDDPIKKADVEKILGQLGDPDKRGSLYH